LLQRESRKKNLEEAAGSEMGWAVRDISRANRQAGPSGGDREVGKGWKKKGQSGMLPCKTRSLKGD
jgi:hypothetical protein